MKLLKFIKDLFCKHTRQTYLHVNSFKADFFEKNEHIKVYSVKCDNCKEILGYAYAGEYATHIEYYDPPKAPRSFQEIAEKYR